MTSPTQLKYLNAIGIPIWVSRDLILDQTLPEPIEDDELPCADSAKSVLEELEAQTVTQPKQAIEIPSQSAPRATQATSNRKQENQIGQTTNHRIFAAGSLQAEWMVIGQSPDTNESASSQPYPYDAGDLLSNMLRAVGIEQPRQQAYLVNILCSATPIDKQAEQLANADLNQQLLEKIKAIKPKIILIVGQLAAQNLLQSSEPLARIRSQQYSLQSSDKQKGKIITLADTQIPVVVTYYPSYLLSKPQDKRKAWDDLKLAMSLLPSDL